MSQTRWVVAACAMAAMVTAGAFGDERKPGGGGTSPAPTGVVSRPLADLAVTSIGFARIQLDPNAAPRKCYGYLFTFTIKNIGQMGSGNFRFQVETAGQSGVYGIWSMGPLNLGPGQSYNHAASPVDNQYWCLDDTWKSKVKVTADIDNKVTETTKSNNVMEKVFEPFHFHPQAVTKKK